MILILNQLLIKINLKSKETNFMVVISTKKMITEITKIKPKRVLQETKTWKAEKTIHPLVGQYINKKWTRMSPWLISTLINSALSSHQWDKVLETLMIFLVITIIIIISWNLHSGITIIIQVKVQAQWLSSITFKTEIPTIMLINILQLALKTDMMTMKAVKLLTLIDPRKLQTLMIFQLMLLKPKLLRSF